MSDLFEPKTDWLTVPEYWTKPDYWAQQSSGLLLSFLRETYGADPDWMWSRFERIGTGMTHTKYDGGIYPYRFSKGPRKGLINYSKPKAGSEATYIVSEADLEAYRPKWEKWTGLCSRCLGQGEVFQSWHHEKGTTMRQCRLCNGTGLATVESEVS